MKKNNQSMKVMKVEQLAKIANNNVQNRSL